MTRKLHLTTLTGITTQYCISSHTLQIKSPKAMKNYTHLAATSFAKYKNPLSQILQVLLHCLKQHGNTQIHLLHIIANSKKSPGQN